MRPEQPLPQMRLAGCTQPTGQVERGPRLPQTEPGRCGLGVPLKFMLLQNCTRHGVWGGSRSARRPAAAQVA